MQIKSLTGMNIIEIIMHADNLKWPWGWKYQAVLTFHQYSQHVRPSSGQTGTYNLVSGVVLISLALCADAVIGNVQEKAMKAHKSSNTEVVSTDK